jgi:hypothetical protein
MSTAVGPSEERKQWLTTLGSSSDNPTEREMAARGRLGQ